MSCAPWSVVEVLDDIDDKLQVFDLLFNEILDHHARIRSVKVRGKPSPCITEIRQFIKSRDVWRKAAPRTNDPQQFDYNYTKLQHYRSNAAWHTLCSLERLVRSVDLANGDT